MGGADHGPLGTYFLTPRNRNCGPITDGADQGDLRMAREYVSRVISNPFQAAAELSRYRAAASATPKARLSGWSSSPPLLHRTQDFLQ